MLLADPSLFQVEGLNSLLTMAVAKQPNAAVRAGGCEIPNLSIGQAAISAQSQR
jgi:hypothetical protein